MRAIVAESPDQLVWQEVPDVAARPGEVLIKVAAAGVNRADVLQAAGKYPPPPGASEIIGMEVSGVIAEVAAEVGSDVTDWSAGQEVCALLAGGGYAEYAAVPAGQVMPIPAGRRPVDAAGMPEVACTVWSNLVMTAHLTEGQLVLLHGGASGIGSHAIQVARALGARVAVTAGSAEKLDLCRELGAQITINYRDEDFVARLRERPTGGADVILDIMGAAYLDRNIDALATGRPADHHRHAGRDQGRAQHRQADGQTGAGHRHHIAGPAGQRTEQQKRDRRSGDGLGLADDRRRAGAADHWCAHAGPRGGRRPPTAGVREGVRQDRPDRLAIRVRSATASSRKDFRTDVTLARER